VWPACARTAVKQHLQLGKMLAVSGSSILYSATRDQKSTQRANDISTLRVMHHEFIWLPMNEVTEHQTPDDGDAPWLKPQVQYCGRGVSENPHNRFENKSHERGPDWSSEDDPAPHTTVLWDDSKSIIAEHNSPDVPFSASINPYRGCEHGCIYCYARPYHEYLGFSAGLDFESKLLAKKNAALLLRQELSHPSWTPQVVVMSNVTDCYQPIERELRLTRACLEVLAEFRNPVGIISKNKLVTRDIDLFTRMNAYHGIAITITVTSLRPEIARDLEPRASNPAARLAAIQQLSAAGIPVAVNIAPVIPGLTDQEIPAIMRAVAEAGARSVNYTIVRLPHGVADLFSAWLDRVAPAAKNKILHRIEHLREGKLHDSQFHRRMVGTGIFAEQIRSLFELHRRRNGLSDDYPTLSTDSFRSPFGKQETIF
jgi:DNA repair photolyase